MQAFKNKQKWIIIALGSLVIAALLSVGLLVRALTQDTEVRSSVVTQAEHGQAMTEKEEEWLTGEEWQAYKEATDRIWELQTPYTDHKGYVKPDKVTEVLKAVGEHAGELTKAGILEEYGVSYTYGNVYMKFASGIPYIYQPPLEGVLSGPGPEKQIDINSLYVITYPVYDAKQNIETMEEIKKNGYIHALRQVDNTFENYTYTKELYFEEVTLEHIKKAFGPNRLLVWAGHGGYGYEIQGKEVKRVLLDTEIKTDTAAKLKGYQKDILSGRCTVVNGNLGLTAEFFRYYCKNMKDSFLLFGSCNVMRDRDFCQAFLDAGAAALLGFDNVVNSSYSDAILKSVLEIMCREDPLTGKYYIAAKALRMAKEIHGAVDPGIGAKPVLMGDEAWRLFEKEPEDVLEISGTVYETKAENKVVGNARIKLYTGMDTVLGETITDENGDFHFELTKEEIRSARIRVEAVGMSRREFVLGTLKKDSYWPIYLKDAMYVRGRVVVSGAKDEDKNSGVRVRICPIGTSGLKGESVTNMEGDFKVEVSKPGIYEVLFEKEGYTTVKRTVQITQRKKQAIVNITMQKPNKISILSVVDDVWEEPIPYRMIRIDGQGKTEFARDIRVQGSGANGLVKTGIDSGTHTITISSRDAKYLKPLKYLKASNYPEPVSWFKEISLKGGTTYVLGTIKIKADRSMELAIDGSQSGEKLSLSAKVYNNSMQAVWSGNVTELPGSIQTHRLPLGVYYVSVESKTHQIDAQEHDLVKMPDGNRGIRVELHACQDVEALRKDIPSRISIKLKQLDISTTPKVTPSPQATATPKATPSPQATVTPRVSPSPQATVTPRVTPSPQATVTPTAAPSPQATVTPKATPNPQTTVTPKITPGPQKIVKPSQSPSPQVTTPLTPAFIST